jgi:antitoxin HigA-1
LLHTTNEDVTMIPKNRPPTHPGVLIQDTIEEMGLTQVELAKRLGIPLQRLNTIVKGKRGVTADTALRLPKVFGTTPELWLNHPDGCGPVGSPEDSQLVGAQDYS